MTINLVFARIAILLLFANLSVGMALPIDSIPAPVAKGVMIAHSMFARTTDVLRLATVLPFDVT